MPLAVYILGLGIFSMTTSEFMVSGMMPLLAANLGVSIVAVGYLLISAYAVGMVVGGPLLTFGLLRLSKKTALLILVATYVAGQSLGALASTYSVLMVRGWSQVLLPRRSSACPSRSAPIWCRSRNVGRLPRSCWAD